MSILEVAEGIRYQASTETRVYTITTTNLVSAPQNPSAVVFDESVDEDVTSTVMPSGSHSVSGDVITLKPLTSLTNNHSYKIWVTFVVGASTYKRYLIVKCIDE